MTVARPLLGKRWVLVRLSVRACSIGPPGRMCSRFIFGHACDSRLAAPLGSSARTAPLIEPMDVPATRSGAIPCSPRAWSMPTWTAPRLPPPPSTNPTGRGRFAMSIRSSFFSSFGVSRFGQLSEEWSGRGSRRMCERSDPFPEEPTGCDIGGVVHSGVDPGESDRGGEGIEWDPQTGICRADDASECSGRCGVARGHRGRTRRRQTSRLGHLIGRSPSPEEALGHQVGEKRGDRRQPRGLRTAVLRPFLPPASDIAAAIAIQILECDAACDNAGMRRSIAGDSHPAIRSNTSSSNSCSRRSRGDLAVTSSRLGRVGRPLKWTMARSLSWSIDSLRLLDWVCLGTRTRSDFGAIVTSTGRLERPQLAVDA